MWADNQQAIDAMVEEIGRATRVVHCEFYILSLDDTTAPFFDALEAAHRRGVKVRVLLDHLGNFQYPGYRRTRKRLDAMGVEWQLMLPLQPFKGKFQRPDLRNHRKLLVVDGAGRVHRLDQRHRPVATSARRTSGAGCEWKDYWARFEGPVVAGIDAIFVTDWYSETDELLTREVAAVRPSDADGIDCQVVPSGPGFSGENNLRLFNSLVYAATHRIILVSPYFVPDDSMLYSITTAAQSGLEVQLFVSEIGDQFLVYHAQRSYYEALLQGGGAHLPVPAADDPARQAHDLRRRGRGHRLEQHGHALVHPRPRDLGDGARGVVPDRAAGASRTTTARSAASSPSRSGRPAPSGPAPSTTSPA